MANKTNKTRLHVYKDITSSFEKSYSGVYCFFVVFHDNTNQ